MKEKKSIKLIVICMVVAIISSFITLFLCGELFVSTNKRKILKKVDEVYSLIENQFLFEYNDKEIADFMVVGMLSALDDDYAIYFPSDLYEDRKMDLEGHTYGIGVSVLPYDDKSGYVKIIQIHDNSPAKEAGLQEQDIVIKIDDKDLKDISYEEATKLIRGNEETVVNLTILRDGTQKQVNVKRKDIELTSVVTKNIDNIGYVKILEFNDSTNKQFIDKIDKLIKQGITGLVFDVRNNPGGSMTAVLDMLDYLLPKGPIVKVTDKNGNEKNYGYSDGNFIDLPMITLTNNNSASASELFVQTLKDYKKAKSVGEKSFGKGIIQTNYQLPDKSTVKFTTQYFSGPYSENFHGKGIQPDVEVVLEEEQNNRLLSNELGLEEDVQLKKAIELLKQ